MSSSLEKWHIISVSLLIASQIESKSQMKIALLDPAQENAIRVAMVESDTDEVNNEEYNLIVRFCSRTPQGKGFRTQLFCELNFEANMLKLLPKFYSM